MGACVTSRGVVGVHKRVRAHGDVGGCAHWEGRLGTMGRTLPLPQIPLQPRVPPAGPVPPQALRLLSPRCHPWAPPVGRGCPRWDVAVPISMLPGCGRGPAAALRPGAGKSPGGGCPAPRPALPLPVPHPGATPVWDGAGRSPRSGEAASEVAAGRESPLVNRNLLRGSGVIQRRYRCRMHGRPGAAGCPRCPGTLFTAWGRAAGRPPAGARSTRSPLCTAPWGAPG